MTEQLKAQILALDVDKYFEHLERFLEANERVPLLRELLGYRCQIPNSDPAKIQHLRDEIRQLDKDFGLWIDMQELGVAFIDRAGFNGLKNLRASAFQTDVENLKVEQEIFSTDDYKPINTALEQAYKDIAPFADEWLSYLPKPLQADGKHLTEAGIFFGRVDFIKYLEPQKEKLKTLKRVQINLPQKLKLLQSLGILKTMHESFASEMNKYEILCLLLDGDDRGLREYLTSDKIRKYQKYEEHKHKEFLDSLINSK